DLFTGLSRVALARLAAGFDAVAFADQAEACVQDEPGDSLYIVSRGTLGVFITAGAEEIQVATFHEGACFGEMALLTDEPRSATVRRWCCARWWTWKSPTSTGRSLPRDAASSTSA